MGNKTEKTNVIFETVTPHANLYLIGEDEN